MLEREMNKEIINDFINKLYSYGGKEIYACDLADTIFEVYNVDGTVTYNIYNAEKFIKKYFREVGYVLESLEYENNFNPFLEPEKTQVIVYLEVADIIVSNIPYIQENWNEKIILNRETIKTIVKELKEVI